MRVLQNELCFLKLNALNCSDCENLTESDVKILNLFLFLIYADCEDWMNLKEKILNLSFWKCDFLIEFWCCILSFHFNVFLKIIEAEIMTSDEIIRSYLFKSDWVNLFKKNFFDVLLLLINILLSLKWFILNDEYS